MLGFSCVTCWNCFSVLVFIAVSIFRVIQVERGYVPILQWYRTWCYPFWRGHIIRMMLKDLRWNKILFHLYMSSWLKLQVWLPCWYGCSKCGHLLELLFCQVKHYILSVCGVWRQQSVSSRSVFASGFWST